MNLNQRWTQLMERLNLGHQRDVLDALTKHYGEPQRFYHNLNHIADCLHWMDAWGAEAPDSKEVDCNALELALWYHDAIYDSRSSENEAASAALLGAHFSAVVVPPAQHLILVTDHRHALSTPAEKVIVSIDLATLGTSPDGYDAYAQAVRQEYAWVPEADYRAGRGKVLRSFLDRDSVYLDPWFRERLEVQARENLSRELHSLEA